LSFVLLCLGTLAAFGQTPADSPEAAANKRIEVAKQELEKVANLVQAGALPRIRQEQAELDVADAQDDAILAHTLYGEMPVKDVTDKLLEDMVAAASGGWNGSRCASIKPRSWWQMELPRNPPLPRLKRN